MPINSDKGKINSSSSLVDVGENLEECTITTTFKVPKGTLDNRDLRNLEKDHRVGTINYLSNTCVNLGGK